MTRENNRRVIYIVLAVVAVLAVAAVVFAMVRASGAKKYDSYFEDGKQYYESGDYDSAVTYLEKAVDIKPKDEAVLMLADCYVNLDERDKALALLEKYSDSSTVRARLEELKASSDSGGGDVEIGGVSFAADTVSLGMSDRELTDTDIANIAKLKGLVSVSLSNNKITDVSALSGLTKLEVLDLSENDIKDIEPLAGLSSLRTLYLDDNDIGDFSPLYKLSRLTTLSIKDIDITESKLKELQDALPDCRIHSEKADEDVVEITLGGVKFKSDVTELDLSGKGISDVSELAKCEDLKKLDLRGNKISDLTPLMDLPELQWLSLRNNRVSDLRPLMGLTRLTYLDLQNNSISSISSIGALSDLTDLYLGGNSVASFAPLADFDALRELGLENTGLEDSEIGSIKSLGNLSKLYVENNPGLTAAGISALQSALPGCKISHSAVKTEITLGAMTYAADSASVDASNLGLTDISAVKGFNNCTTLILSGNGITDISPLAKMMNVRTLDLRDNKITDISALKGMAGLQSLDLSGNSITDVTPLLSMTWLKELYISSSGLTEQQVDSLYKSLSGCSISVDGNVQ